jgi:ectoine hydroxylase-related dioxygenase (phytanoyl-CoA dioxygenase family)
VLIEAQIEQEGWAVVEHVFDDAECDALATALAPHTEAHRRAGARHLLALPAVAALASDPRLIALAARVLGGRAVPFRATLFVKSGRANWLVAWHQDTALPFVLRHGAPGFGPWSVKDGVAYAHVPTWALEQVVALRVHLDAATPHNGALRVLPGSHRLGVLEDEEVHRLAREQAGVCAVAGRGAVLAMSPLLIHASSKVERDLPRRVLHIEYAPALDLAVGIRLAVT